MMRSTVLAPSFTIFTHRPAHAETCALPSFTRPPGAAFFPPSQPTDCFRNRFTHFTRPPVDCFPIAYPRRRAFPVSTKKGVPLPFERRTPLSIAPRICSDPRRLCRNYKGVRHSFQNDGRLCPWSL